MSRLPVILPDRLVRALRSIGFEIERQKGSHAHLRHKDGRRTIVPMHPVPLKKGTLTGILRDTYLTSDQLRGLL